MPEEDWNLERLVEFTAKENLYTMSTAFILNFNKAGLPTRQITEFDYPEFIREGIGYIEPVADPLP